MINKTVILVCFDLPVNTKEERRQYRLFRKKLIKEGFMMFQKSVYVKLIPHSKYAKSEIQRVKLDNDVSGEVGIVVLSLPEFQQIKMLGKSSFDFNLFSDDIVFI